MPDRSRDDPRVATVRRAPRALEPLLRNALVLVGTAAVIALVVLAVAAPSVSPYDPIAVTMADSLQAPSWSHWFGTDRFGRDILSRTIYGARSSLWLGISSVALATLIGSAAGLASGYLGRWADVLISRVADVLFGFPALLLAIIIAAMLGPSLNVALVAIAVVYTPLFDRVARGATLVERNKEYVESARALGASHWRIVTRHIIPNVLSPIIVQASLCLSSAILLEASLSYLGLGTQPPAPSWGTMLSEGRTYLELAPWISIFPGAAIMTAVLSFNILGDGLRDVLDPQARGA